MGRKRRGKLEGEEEGEEGGGIYLILCLE